MDFHENDQRGVQRTDHLGLDYQPSLLSACGPRIGPLSISRTRSMISFRLFRCSLVSVSALDADDYRSPFQTIQTPPCPLDATPTPHIVNTVFITHTPTIQSDPVHVLTIKHTYILGCISPAPSITMLSLASSSPVSFIFVSQDK